MHATATDLNSLFLWWPSLC